MSLSIDGVWKAGVWATTVWADGVWREGPYNPTPTPTPAVSTGAGRRVRRRQRIVLRINGELREVDDLEQVLEVLKAVKKDVPQTAREAAAQIVRSGRKIGDARSEQRNAIEVVDAPYSIRDMVQTRLEEVERLFWRRVAANVKALQEDDDDVMMLI